MLKELKEILSGAAQLPEPTDYTFPLAQRLRGMRCVVASFGVTKTLVWAVAFGQDGAYAVIATDAFEHDDDALTGRDLRKFAAEHKATLCVANICKVSSAAVVLSRGNYPANANDMQASLALLADPTETIGKGAGFSSSPGKRYHAIRSLDADQQLVFEFDSVDLARIQRACDSAGLSLVRTQCASATVIANLMHTHVDDMRSYDILIGDVQSATLLLTDDHGYWSGCMTQFDHEFTMSSYAERLNSSELSDKLHRNTSRPVLAVSLADYSVSDAIATVVRAAEFKELEGKDITLAAILAN